MGLKRWKSINQLVCASTTMIVVDFLVFAVVYKWFANKMLRLIFFDGATGWHHKGTLPSIENDLLLTMWMISMILI